MTKKEIIIKAWMDLNIETPFGICDKTGWVHGYFCNGIDDIINDYGDITDKIDYDIDMSGVGKFRPKSLHEIENNNGWVKIESEEDLPKEDVMYRLGFFISSDKFYQDSNLYSLKTALCALKESYYTHYQQIPEFKLPIF